MEFFIYSALNQKFHSNQNMFKYLLYALCNSMPTPLLWWEETDKIKLTNQVILGGGICPKPCWSLLTALCAIQVWAFLSQHHCVGHWYVQIVLHGSSYSRETDKYCTESFLFSSWKSVKPWWAHHTVHKEDRKLWWNI